MALRGRKIKILENCISIISFMIMITELCLAVFTVFTELGTSCALANRKLRISCGVSDLAWSTKLL